MDELKLLDVYRRDQDPGMHGAAAWLLTVWGHRDAAKRIDGELVKTVKSGPGNVAVPGWFVNTQGQTFTVIPPSKASFKMGSPRWELSRDRGPLGRIEELHERKISRAFAISMHEVTVEQFLRFRENHGFLRDKAPSPDCPVNAVTWYDAAAYCNWLSKEEGLPENDWCYQANAKGEYKPGMSLKPNHKNLRGYRLPTEGEWEFACRAGSATSRHFGETDELLAHYAWFSVNSQQLRTAPVGSMMPNDLGLFDMLGNVQEWTEDQFADYLPQQMRLKIIEDEEKTGGIRNEATRILRGGGFMNQALYLRSAQRFWFVPSVFAGNAGFRVAKTL